MLDADRYTPVDDTLIPTGEIAPGRRARRSTSRSPTRDRRPHRADARHDPVGYDHNFVLNGGRRVSWPGGAASTSRRAAGCWRCRTTEPGVQFYTGNFLDGTITGKGGIVYSQHHGFCLETQHFPDSPNHPNFPSTVLRPGEKYQKTTVYRFSTEMS